MMKWASLAVCLLAAVPALCEGAHATVRLRERSLLAGPIVLDPAALPVALTGAAGTTLNVPIVPAVAKNNPAAVVSYARSTYPAAVGAAVGADGKSVTLTLVDPTKMPRFLPVAVAYAVTDAGATGVGTLLVSASGAGLVLPSPPPFTLPSPRPFPLLSPWPLPSTPPLQWSPRPANAPPALTGPAPPALAAALGVPLTIDATAAGLLAGWADPEGDAFGVIGATVSPARGGGVVMPTAITPGSWTGLAALQNRRISELAYTCGVGLGDVTPGVAGAPATVKTPACVSGGATINFAVADARFATASGTQAVTVAPATALPVQLFGSPFATLPLAKRAGFVYAPAPTVTAAAITFGAAATASITPLSGEAVSAGPLPGSVTVAPAAGAASAAVQLDFAPPVTLFDLTAAIPYPGSGKLALTLTVQDAAGAATYPVKYQLVGPVPIKLARAYSGAAVFGGVITSAVVQATALSTGAAVTLFGFDASVTPLPMVTFT